MNPFVKGFLKRAQQLQAAGFKKVPESIKPVRTPAQDAGAQAVPTPVGEVADKGVAIPSQPL